MIITIEGNIGAGKTSFAHSLYSMMENEGQPVIYIPEPVNGWQDVGGDNLLDMFYSDRQRWAFTFQVNALMQTTELDKNALKFSNDGWTVIRERSSYSCRSIFIPLVSEGLTAAEQHILKGICTAFSSPLLLAEEANRTTNMTVYLRTDPKACFQRVNKRGRPEEINKVNLNYLQRLHELHEKQFSEAFGTGRLVIADGNSFDETDATSVKIFGGHDQVLNTIVGALVDDHPKAMETTDS